MNTLLQYKDQIVQCEQQLLEAIKANNVLQLDQLLHEELLFTIPDGRTITKDIDLETYRSGNMKVQKLLTSEQIIHIIDQTTAVVTVTIHLEGMYFEQPVNGNFRYLRVWKSVQDQWKIIAGSCIQL